MSRSIPVKYVLFLLLFIWILPVSKDVGRIFLPFLLGAALALTAEPVVTLLGQKLASRSWNRLRRNRHRQEPGRCDAAC